MKKLSFFRFSSAFIMFLWLFGHQIQGQQLICPSLLIEEAENAVPFSKDWNQGLSSGTKYIPTVVHLIGDASSLTFNQVKSAIDQLNADFVDPNGTHTIVFVLATVGHKGQCTDGITRHPNILYNDQLYKQKTGWPNEKYFNIWVLSNPDVLGSVSARPSKFQVQNGVLVREDYIAGQSGSLDGEDGVTVNTSEIYPNNTGGHTLTHETGHWLNLLHVFSPCEAPISWDPAIWDCCGVGASQGDFIEDTPHQSNFATANPADCTQTFSSCGNSTVSQENFMSYGGPCINSFTNGQRDWMTHCLDNFRPDIWSDANLRCTGVGSESNPMISTGQNITWSASKTVTGSLIIEAGGTLTIGSGVIVQFCDAGKVIIKQGGRLNLYGTLTSSCVGRMWQGVEVWGTKTQNQSNQVASQGQLWGYPGALVEHAKTGVILNNPADATGGSTGGVLVCERVSFLNNARSVQFEPYENKLSSWFKNFFVGITAGNTDIGGAKPYSFQVDKTLFEGNWRGIQSTAGSRAVITRNTFKLGKIPPNASPIQSIVGLILNDTHTSFVVEENSFSKDPAISQDVADFWKLTGIEAVSIGEFSNQIRKNYFTDLKIGNRSVGENAKPNGEIGLLYLCNENSGNDEFDFRQENGRIKSVQSFVDPNDLSGTNRPAGNFFSLTGPTGSDSDFKNQFNIDYVHSTTIPEIPVFFDVNKLNKVSVNQSRSCESIFCAPPCRTEAEAAAIKQQIDKDAFSRDSLNALLLVGGTDQGTTDLRKQQRNFLTYRTQANATEVSVHLAYSDEGSNAVFRDVLAKSDAYDADLALANDYLGSSEIGNYSATLNSLTTKYQLTGTVLDEFNAYRAVTDMMAQHYTNGGNKYTLGILQIDWLKDIADNSTYARSRGMARRILRIYGYFYPVDYGTKSEERRIQVTQSTMPELFSVFPNPASQQVRVHIETGTITDETVTARLIRLDGGVQEERHTTIRGSGDFLFNVQALASGIYIVQVRLDSGKIQTKRIAVSH